MSATDTVVRVLRWAAADPVRPPPDGTPADADALVAPPPAVAEAAGVLAAVTAARLRLPAPPLGDSDPIGTGAVLLALGIGIRNMPVGEVTFRKRKYPHPAALFADLAADVGDPASGAPGEWVVRHGLIGPAAPFLSPDLRAAALRASPLTAVLDLPPAGDEELALAVADRVWAAPHGARLLARALAAPGAPTAVRCWRARWLDRWRVRDDRRAFVIDVYEAAMTAHREALLAEIAGARAALVAAAEPVAPEPDPDPDAPPAAPLAEESRARDALAVAAWWGPLALVARAYPEEIRARRAFGYDYLPGVRLYRLAQRQTGGAV